MRRWLRRAVTVVATSLALILGTAAVAHAGTDAVSEMTGSRVTFISYGDKFRVCDTSWDGWNVYVKYEYVRIDGSFQTGTHFVTTGDGTCGTFDHNFGEGRIVTFIACVEIWPYPDLCADRWSTGIA